MQLEIDNMEYRVTKAISSDKQLFFLTERKIKGSWQLFLGRAHPRTARLYDSEKEAELAIREWHSNLKHFNGGFL